MSKLTRLDLFLFSLGSAGCVLLLRTMMIWIAISLAGPESTYFKTVGYIGIALLISQIADAIVDPFIGYFTSFLGKRKINVLLIFPIPFTATYLWAFSPVTDTPSLENNIFLITAVVLFRVFFSIYHIVFLSLIPDLSNTDDDRKSLSSWVGFGTLLGAGLIMLLGGVLVENFGFTKMIWIIGGIACALLFLPLGMLFKHQQRIKDCSVSPRPPGGIFKSYYEILKSPGFFWAIVAILGMNVAYTTLSIVGPFISTSVLLKSNTWTSVLLGSAFVASLLTISFVPRFVSKLGLAKVTVVSLSFFSLSLLGMSATSFIQIEMQAFIMIFFFVLSGVALGLSLTLTNLLISQFSALAPSTMLYGAYGTLLRFESGLTTLGVTLVLEHFGKVPENSSGVPVSLALASFAIFMIIIAFRTYYSNPAPSER